MLREHFHTKSESLAKICAIITELQHFSKGLYFYWRTLYVTVLGQV